MKVVDQELLHDFIKEIYVNDPYDTPPMEITWDINMGFDIAHYECSTMYIYINVSDGNIFSTCKVNNDRRRAKGMKECLELMKHYISKL